MKLKEEEKYEVQHSTKKLKDWAVGDVISWLENKNLHKFIFLFQKHHVTGKELVDLSLPFLEDYEHISMWERETLLSEIYQLLNPGRVHASEEDLTKLRSPVEKKKYFAAIEVAKVKSLSLPRSSSAILLPTHQSSKSLSNRSSPLVKPRHSSESGADNQGKPPVFFASRLPDHKKRKTMTKVCSSSLPTVFQYIQQYGSQCLRCIELSPLCHSDITMVTNTEGHVTLETVPDSLADSLHVGDRLLEINGHLVHTAMKDPKSCLKVMMNSKSPISLVVLTKHIKQQQQPQEHYQQQQQQELDMDTEMEGKWSQLHKMLVEMRDDPVYVQSDVTTLPLDQQQYLAHTILLQEEIQTLQEKVLEQRKLQERLQTELELKEAALHDVEMSRDKALEKLNDSRHPSKHKSTKESLGGKEYYNMTMNSLNVEDASKEEVLDSLKEIVTEASKQKWYLDRLISMVIEESPWLLDEVDTEFDNLTLTSEGEEFC